MRALCIFLTIVGVALIITSIPACDLVVIPGVLQGNFIARATFAALLVVSGVICLLTAAGLWRRQKKTD